MKRVVFERSALRGEVQAPPSKSAAHRAVICAALADGVSRISNIALSDDISATIGAVRAMGAEVSVSDGYAVIKGARGAENAEIDCAESGSTLRFCLPVAAQICRGATRFTGRGRLGSRPMSVYEKIWRERGLLYEDRSEGGKLDLTAGGRLGGGIFAIDGGISSQFVSGIMFAAAARGDGAKISFSSAPESRGYVNMTAEALSSAGARVVMTDRGIEVGGVCSPFEREVEGDWSQAAFFMTAGAIGAEVNVSGLSENSLQGDKVIKEWLQTLACGKGRLVFDCRDVPDIVPVFAVACALREGETELSGLARLRIKESDRFEAVRSQLSLIGADVTARGDSLVFRGVPEFEGGADTSSFGDHRIAMALAVAALRCKRPISVDDCSCMSKSYPDFLSEYERLGGKCL